MVLERPLDFEDDVAAGALRLEDDIGIFARGDRHILEGQLLQKLFARGSLLGLGGVGAEALDECLEFIGLVGRLAVLLLLLLQGQLAGLIPEVVVADIDVDLAEVDIGDMGADLVQEVAVVGDDDDGVLEAEEEILQPGDGLQIEMVGRLVQQEHVRVAEKGLGEEHPHLVPRFQLLHPLLPQLLRDAEAVQQHRRLGFRFVAVHLGKFRLQLAGADAVLLGELRLGVDRLALGHDLEEARVPHDDGVEDRLLVEGELVLPQHRDPLAGADDDLPLVRLDLAGENLQKGRLAGAVGADQAVAVARGELDIDVLENDPLAVGKGDIGCADHLLSAFLG